MTKREKTYHGRKKIPRINPYLSSKLPIDGIRSPYRGGIRLEREIPVTFNPIIDPHGIKLDKYHEMKGKGYIDDLISIPGGVLCNNYETSRRYFRCCAR